jgi:hypothetical protein
MTTKVMTKQSHSYNQNQLKVLCDQVCDRIDELLDVLDLSHDITLNGKMFVGKCPIHNGDNLSAFNLYPDGESYRGNWKCRTHNCEKFFKSSIIGFIRGVLSQKKYQWQTSGDKAVGFDDTIKFIEDFLGKRLKDIKISKSETEKRLFSSLVQNIVGEIKESVPKVSRRSIRDSLIIPSEYFVGRGFDSKILDKYDIGLCDKPEKEMYNRAVAPIYDMSGKYMVGCTGRSIFNKCDSCGSFHNPNHSCPDESNKWKFVKWKHNYQFKSQNHLYNMWFAKDYILESTKVILVESPGNVWKLEENGIHNAVALFGSNLSDKQKILLDGSGAMTIISIMDNDDAGQKASEMIFNKCKNTYNVIKISISKPDIAEMTSQEINTEIKRYL